MIDMISLRQTTDNKKVFSFYEINPGLGIFGYAATLAGGIPYGGELVTDVALDSFRSWYGTDSVNDPYIPPQVVLANLQFSAFIDFEQPDPEVLDVLNALALRSKKSKLAIVRMDWTIGRRLGLSYIGLESLVASKLKGYSIRTFLVQNSDYLRMDGCELFILAAKKMETELIIPPGEFRSSSNQNVMEGIRFFPEDRAERFDASYISQPETYIEEQGTIRPLTSKEIMEILGIPNEYPVPSNEIGAYQVVCSSVAVPVALNVILMAISAACII